MFALTWPQFQKCGEMLDRIGWRRALNEVFFGVLAAFGEGKDRDNLFSSAGTFVKCDKPAIAAGRWVKGRDYTEDDVANAIERTQEILRKMKQQEEENNA